LRAIQNAKAHIKMKDLRERQKSNLKEISSLFSHIALQSMQAGAAVGFLLAGRENGKTLLYEVSVDGIVKEVNDYVIDGSGMMHVNAILDTEYKEGMSLEEGIKLAKRCIIGASGRDPATGIGYEIWKVTPEKIEKLDDKIWEKN
jgi:20S proteasome alpha/beta subunit